MKKNKKALITGISGQDGAYLADLLLSKGYKVSAEIGEQQAVAYGDLKNLALKIKYQLLILS